MDLLVVGEVAVLEDGKEFVCGATAVKDGINYVYLFSNFKPLEVKFARQAIVNNQLELTIVEDGNEKMQVFELFKSQFEQ